MNFDKMFLEILFLRSFTNRSDRFSEFDRQNVILFEIKVFRRNIKETTPARYFIKVTVPSSFTRLRVIKYQNGKYLTEIQLYLFLI